MSLTSNSVPSTLHYMSEFTSKTVSIYALGDPRSGSIKYVGKSFDPYVRWLQHMEPSHSNDGTPKSIWVNALLALGLEPDLIELETVPESQWGEAERRWVTKLRAEGHNLLNGTRGGPGGYAESRWQKQREKGPVPRNTKSGILGVQYGKSTNKNGVTYEYWFAQVTRFGKQFTQTFPYTDDGKQQAATWYEQSKQRVDQGLEPIVVKKPKPAASGIPGLAHVAYRYTEVWRASVKSDGTWRHRDFRFTDEGKEQALNWLTEHRNGKGLLPARPTVRRPSGVEGVYYQHSAQYEYWAGMIETPERTYVQTFPYTEEGKVLAGEWYITNKQRYDDGLKPVVIKRGRKPQSCMRGLGHIVKRGVDLWRAVVRVSGEQLGTRTFPYTEEGKRQAAEWVEHQIKELVLK